VRPPRGAVKHELRTSLRFRFSTLQFAASRMTIAARCGAEDDEQFRRRAQRSIVLNEGRHERRERPRADAESGSGVGAARRVGRGRALANGTRVKENLGSPLRSIGLGRSGSASSHAPGSGNSHAIHLHRKMGVHSMMRCDSHASRRAKTNVLRIHARPDAILEGAQFDRVQERF
jgi:hypothetical protein